MGQDGIMDRVKCKRGEIARPDLHIWYNGINVHLRITRSGDDEQWRRHEAMGRANLAVGGVGGHVHAWL